jgi:hypothetical protein
MSMGAFYFTRFVTRNPQQLLDKSKRNGQAEYLTSAFGEQAERFRHNPLRRAVDGREIEVPGLTNIAHRYVTPRDSAKTDRYLDDRE